MRLRLKVRNLPMREFNEAVVLIAKCGESRRTYGMRLEKIGHDRWLATWVFPIRESSAKLLLNPSPGERFSAYKKA